MMILTQLERFYFDDKKDRRLFENGTITQNQLQQNDEARLKTILQLLASNAIDLNEIWNLHYLCLLFMHSWSVEPAAYKKAHHFAKKAVSLGSRVTRWLYAASLDRLLVAQGKKQKFGTQFDTKTGAILPYETTTTNNQREKYGVPPLSELLQR